LSAKIESGETTLPGRFYPFKSRLKHCRHRA
jgi:hypothetical protein